MNLPRLILLAIFSGVHTYISSSWYNHENVPTWNYLAVHVSGKIRLIEGQELMDHLKSLTDTIYDLLIRIYPNKDVEHFQIQRKAATVAFVGSGLSVDIVPVIEDDKRPNYGWQFDLQNGSKVQTCCL